MPVVLVPVLVFLAVIAVVVALVRKSLTRQREQKALVTQHPDEPWLWRRDWANRAVQDGNVVPTGFLWFFGIFWLLITSPVVFVFIQQPARQPVHLMLFLFPVAGISILAGAAYLTLRRRKYGVSICHIEHLPVSIGKTFRGSVVARVRELPPEGFRLKLSNLRRTVTGSGKNRSVHERVIWQDQQVVRTGAMPNPDGLRIPIAFPIPADGEPADDRNANNRVIWRLEVEAEVPGIDYKAQFELPVFRTGEVDAWTLDVDPRGWVPASDSGIALGVAQQGEEIHTRPTQRMGSWIVLLVFFALWFVALGFMTVMGAPIVIVAVFGLITLVVLLLLGDLFLGHSRVVVGTGCVLTRRTWLGLGRKPRTVQSADVESVAPEVGLTSGSRVYHDVVITLRNGEKVRALKHVALRRDAEMLAAKLRRAMKVS